MSRNLLRVIASLFVLFLGTLLSARADDPKQSPPDKPASVLKDDDAIKEQDGQIIDVKAYGLVRCP